MPLPNSKVIPDGWSEYHRPTAELALTAAGELRRPGHQTGFDETTGRSQYVDPSVYHSGSCRIQALARTQGAADVGDRQVTVRPYRVSWSVDVPEVRINDQVAVTVCTDDPQLVGHILRVVDIPEGSLLWQRDLICEDITPTIR